MSAIAREGHAMPRETVTRVRNLLRAAYPRHTAKLAAAAADVPIETSRNWVRGRATPSASTLLVMASRCERMADALLRMVHDRRAARAVGTATTLHGDASAADRGAQV